MTVVDLSKYQGVIPVSWFQAWRQAGVTRVILKIGGGDSGRYADSKFAQNLANANAGGMPADGYWFNGTTDPVADAEFAHSIIPARMRIWWDVENEGSMPHWSDSSLNAAARRGVALGHPGGTYMSSSVTFEGWSQSNWMPLWVAGYGFSSVPPVGGGWRAVLWQYTSSGSMPGYNGYLDISELLSGFANLNNVTPINNTPTPTPSFGEDMTRIYLVLTPQAGKATFDYWLVNPAEHTKAKLGIDEWNWLVALNNPNIVQVNGGQPPAVIASYKAI